MNERERNAGGNITGSRVYRQAFADEFATLKSGRFVPAKGDALKPPIIGAKPSRAKGKARRRKAAKK